MDGITDEELVSEIKRGSKAAMEILVRRYYGKIYSYCVRHVGKITEAEDLTHDIFLKMMKSICQYKPRGGFSNWLMTIGVNTCRNYLASAYHRYESTADDVYELQLAQDDVLEESIDRQTEKAAIAKYLQMLPESQREAILLRFYCDLKLTDIAAVTSVSLPTVKYRIKKAACKLKEWMEAYQVDGERRTEIRIIK